MSQDFSVALQGFDEAQRKMLRAVRATQPKGALGQGVKDTLLMAQAVAAEVSHIDTGTLIRSHVIYWDGGDRGEVTPSPYNINPKSHKPPSVYGPYEASKGGDHDFYALTMQKIQPRVSATVSARIESYIG